MSAQLGVRERRIAQYIDKAMSLHDSADGARIYLAVFIANTAAGNRTPTVPETLIEAYRRVRAMAEASDD